MNVCRNSSPTRAGPFGRNAAATRAIRDAVRATGWQTPIVCAGGVHNFEMAERWLKEGVCDVVAAARQSLADPDWALKLSLGRGAEVRTCEFTNYCEALDPKAQARHLPVVGPRKLGPTRCADAGRQASAGRAGMAAVIGPTGHVDEFTRARLPPAEEWPDMPSAGFDYPQYLNAAVELTDRMVERGFGDRVALIGEGRRRSYRELADWTNQLARALIEDCGVVPGNRVLIRCGNNPALVACWLAATKAGAVVVNTMPMLRAGELTKVVDKAEIALALCDARLTGELETCAAASSYLKKDRQLRWDRRERRRAGPSCAYQINGARRRADRARRRRSARLHVGFDGRPEGDDAFSPRSAHHRGRLCEMGA